MSTITRTYSFTDGTTAYGSQVESEISNIVTVFNNHDSASSSWTTLSVTGDAYTVIWTDYSGTSSITGWSSFTTKSIFYKKLGKIVFVQFEIVGTSNSTAASFTLPYTQANSVDLYSSGYSVDNGTARTLDAEFPKNGATVNLSPTAGTATWVASGTKACRGQFWYQTT